MRHLPLILILLLSTGCATLTETDPTARWSVEEFYQQAHQALEAGNFASALNLYGKLEARFPYGVYAQQAQLETAYAYYKSNEPEAAIMAADRFIKLHPRHPNADYAYYIRGVASFRPEPGLFEKMFPQDQAERDPALARRSFEYFEQLVRRFPESRYAADSLQRMRWLRNNLARHEVQVAEYYFKRGAHVAAANRARYVVENYDRTPSVPDALGQMIRSYRAMGKNELADDAMRVFETNYPERALLFRVESGEAGRQVTPKGE